MKLYIQNLLLSSLLIGFCALTACKKDPNSTGLEFAPQMYVSKPYEPYTQVKPNPINPNGLNLRHPAENTIPRRAYDPVMMTTDSAGNETRTVSLIYDIPRDDAGREMAAKVLTNPIPVTDKSLAEGKKLYEQFCLPCHGAEGKGKGKVAEQYKGVANLTSDALKNLPSGHIFHVITNGKGLMWPHGSQLNPDERWKVVQYVQNLMGQDIAPEGSEESEESTDSPEAEAEMESTETETTEK